MKILLATNNIHKTDEIKRIVNDSEFEFCTLKDIGLNIEIEEDRDTLEGNAEKKAEEVFNSIGITSLADDTGLFVEYLNGEPGVFSSRYAGENVTYDDNCNKLLQELEGIDKERRSAYFETVVCYFDGKEKHFFKGRIEGVIIEEKRGSRGFGYDPIFLPDGYEKTFAELPPDIKNQISHRAIAFKKFAEFIKQDKR